jgi:hypothetical protein
LKVIGMIRRTISLSNDMKFCKFIIILTCKHVLGAHACWEEVYFITNDCLRKWKVANLFKKKGLNWIFKYAFRCCLIMWLCVIFKLATRIYVWTWNWTKARQTSFASSTLHHLIFKIHRQMHIKIEKNHQNIKLLKTSTIAIFFFIG